MMCPTFVLWNCADIGSHKNAKRHCLRVLFNYNHNNKVSLKTHSVKRNNKYYKIVQYIILEHMYFVKSDKFYECSLTQPVKYLTNLIVLCYNPYNRTRHA